MAMSRKNYEAIAKAINEAREQIETYGNSNEAVQAWRHGIENAAQCIANHMQSDNKKFNRDRFIAACGFKL